MQQLCIDVPDEIHSKFKSWCALNRTTMTDRVNQMIQETIGDSNSKSDNRESD